MEMCRPAAKADVVGLDSMLKVPTFEAWTCNRVEIAMSQFRCVNGHQKVELMAIEISKTSKRA